MAKLQDIPYGRLCVEINYFLSDTIFLFDVLYLQHNPYRIHLVESSQPIAPASQNPKVTQFCEKFQRSEYSVAVASATKTISNFSHGKRAMSFQTLNANAYRIDNRDRNYRDHSIDLG